MKYVIVGAGLFGLTLAERIANDKNCDITILEKRNHIGGNCYSTIDTETGIEIHPYGPHVFHTADEQVWSYINRFSKFNNYRHKVVIDYQQRKYFMPINLKTINEYFNTNYNPAQAKDFMQYIAEFRGIPANLEEKAISLIGSNLYNTFIKGYTTKQWGTDPKNLPASIITRIPIRLNYDTDYFGNQYQGLPLDGYTDMFEKMITNPKIEIILGWDKRKTLLLGKDTLVIYTGPIDEFFKYQYGQLNWRTMQFKQYAMPTDDYQGTYVMNYADLEQPYTRILEFKHAHPERQYKSGKTVIVKEYSIKTEKGMDPYYPVRTDIDLELYTKYVKLAEEQKGIIFAGRLGTYQYLDMGDTITAALTLYEERIK